MPAPVADPDDVVVGAGVALTACGEQAVSRAAIVTAATSATIDGLEHRRFLMKPGMTGLGELYEQSTLPWEERLRLDMYYIENWSIVGDVIILWPTVRAARRAPRRR
ncbi:sugar transferase [Cryobacterium sp. MDB2-33-2]|uniref:sugar transferase n=1 Tax=Cryobacterium sp. MDB2-33-2 TaxID=1259179 RepID=UPI00106B7E50|nr:hypothetical protein E3O59_06865 [Cryobacterium sp. MDB2-33-2]